MDNFKFFTYNISLLKGFKYTLERQYILSFKNVKGFFVLHVDTKRIHFKISNQLLRKLKIIKLSNEKNLNKIEYNLCKLIDLSKEKDNEIFYSDCISGTSGSNGYNFEEEIVEQKKEMSKYHSKIQNNKFKKYKK